MDKRDLAAVFRDRLRQLIAEQEGGLARFAREAGLDRSALSQFLDPGVVRLPRAETLRRLAETKGVTVDWLLGVSNAREGRREFASSVELEQAVHPDGGTPLERWRREAAGAKLRYVPSTLPDMLRLPEVMDYELGADRAAARLEIGDQVLDGARLGDMDVEIAMPVQALEDFAAGAGIWSALDAPARRRQLAHMAALTEAEYPVIRLHLLDGRRTFAPPFTCFGMIRAAIYLGRTYLVLTAADQVRSLARLFDGLVREAAIGPDRAHEKLAELSRAVVAPPRRDQ